MTNEKISDIIREMRDEVRTSRENNPDPRTRIFLSTSNMAIEDFADRIEAAYNHQRQDGSLCTMSCRESGELLNQYMGENKSLHAEIMKCYEKITKLRGLVVLLTSALERATVMRCVEADSGFPCKDLFDDDSCGAANCKSMCGRWRELIEKAKKEVKDA